MSYSERTLECNVVSFNAGNGLVRDHGLAILQLRSDVYRLPLDRCIGGGKDVLDALPVVRGVRRQGDIRGLDARAERTGHAGECDDRRAE